MTIEVIGDGNTDGTNFGSSGDKLGFFGLTTPIVKGTITAMTTATATTTLNELRITRLYTKLEALGLIATAAP